MNKLSPFIDFTVLNLAYGQMFMYRSFGLVTDIIKNKAPLSIINFERSYVLDYIVKLHSANTQKCHMIFILFSPHNLPIIIYNQIKLQAYIKYSFRDITLTKLQSQNILT